MPYPNEHACRLENPDKYDSFARTNRKSASHDGKEYVVIRGRAEDSEQWEDQAYRYDKDAWSETEAKDHCGEHDGAFEAASGAEACAPGGEKRRVTAKHALAFVTSSVWAITPEALETILSIVNRENADPEAVAAEIGQPLQNTRTVTVRDGVATIPITGPMFRYANMFTEVSGATSMEVLATDLNAAVADPDVESILLAVDSPGGEAQGCDDMAALVYGIRGKKPIVAHISGYGASAAYWVASGADEIVVSQTAFVGSIGVIMTVAGSPPDGQQNMFGEREYEFVSSQSPNKKTDPVSKDGRVRIQAIVDQVGGVVVGDVARNRGVSEKTVLSDFGRGDIFVGASAVDAGLADRVATFEETHRALATNMTGVLPLRQAPAAKTEQLKDLKAFRVPASAGLVARACYETGLVPAALEQIAVVGAVPRPEIGSPAAKAAIPEGKVMSDKQPQDGGAAPQGAAKDEGFRTRLTEVKNLCAAAGYPEKAIDYAEGDKTISEINSELMAKMREEVTPLPQPSPEQLEAAQKIKVGKDREAEQPFASLGEQLVAIAAASAPVGVNIGGRVGGEVDKRLLRIQAAASGASSAVGSEGGFLIQKDFTVDLMKESFENGELARRCSQTPIGANADGLEVVYVEETSRATGSRWGGVQVYRAAEADNVTATKPKLGKWECRLEDLMGLAYMTEREMQDAPAMASVFGEAFRDEFGFVIDDEVYRGTGAGQCLGLLNAGALVTVSAEDGQTADTVWAENLSKMWASVLPRAKARGVWFINTEVNPQLDALMYGTGVSGQLVYMPAGGMSGAPYGTIRGRPVIEIEQASALGDLGDIMFADLGYYKLITKGGVQEAESIHVRFIYNERTFRWVSRVNGAPKLKSSISPYKGATGAALSPFVTLAARA